MFECEHVMYSSYTVFERHQLTIENYFFFQQFIITHKISSMKVEISKEDFGLQDCKLTGFQH